MGKPSKAILEFMERYKIDSDEIWEVHGSSWVVKHRALERVAAEQNIIWERPAMLECNSADGVAAMCVFGKLGERMEWSIGEALVARQDRVGGNYKVTGKQAGYVYAMAEKRAKDRVILKLLNAHGALYSESEADEFAEQRPEKRGELPKKDAKPVYTKLQSEIQSCVSREQLKVWGAANKDRIEVLPEDWRDILRLQYEEMMADLRQREAV